LGVDTHGKKGQKTDGGQENGGAADTMTASNKDYSNMWQEIRYSPQKGNSDAKKMTGRGVLAWGTRDQTTLAKLFIDKGLRATQSGSSVLASPANRTVVSRRGGMVGRQEKGIFFGRDTIKHKGMPYAKKKCNSWHGEFRRVPERQFLCELSAFCLGAAVQNLHF
jgi:hypothetical protein